MAIDDEAVQTVARKVIDDPESVLLKWSGARISGGLTGEVGLSGGVHRISGTILSRGARTEWSVILKVLRHVPIKVGEVEVEREDSGTFDYWRREALAYSSGLLDELGDGLVAPRWFGSVEDTEGEIGLWLEDLPGVGPSEWPLGRYGLAARHLGRFNGAYLAGRRMPAHPWLSHGRTREWLAMGAPGIRNLADGRRSGFISTWLSDASVARIQRLWAERRRLQRALESLPRSLCHHDATRRNLASLFVSGQPRTVAIDWQGLGIGHLGEELAAMVCVSLQFLDVPIDAAHDFERDAFAGYVQGLRETGWDGDERAVRFGYAAAASLFLGVGGAGV
jgi:hypothetical protein